MTILSRIRARVGLLVGIIFLALLAFVLTDLFNSQRGIFSGSGRDDMGEINGHTVTYTEFMNRMTEITKGKSPSEAEQSQLSDGIWQELIDKYVYSQQYDALGLQITVTELAAQMYADHPSPYMNQFFQDRQTGRVYDQFAGPDGQLSGEAVRKYANSLSGDGEEQWALVETDMKKFLIREKYNNLLRKGFYVTSSETRHQYDDANTKYNIKFIGKKFSDLNDSMVKVTTEDLHNYYDGHQWKFKQSENQRSMEFLAFNLYPSADDIAQQRTDMDTLASQFKATKKDEDSLFAVANDDEGMYNVKTLHPGQFPVGSDSAFIKAAPGEVLGPFNEGENITIYKKISDTMGVDSVRIRHCLVAYKGGERAGPEITRSKEKAKMRADSILRVIKGGKKLEDIVEQLSDDPGVKQGNKGDYGWFTMESGFVQPFKDAGFNNPVGAKIVIETDFGYHVIEVLDKSAASTKVKVLEISKKVVPSSTTVDGVYNEALLFANTNNTGDLFTKAVLKDNKQVFKADKISEGSKNVTGITTNVREIVRWMYDDKTEVGTISTPYRDGDRYVVCHLTSILSKGTKPFDDPDVQEICSVEAKKIKKAQMFSDELMKNKATSLDQWSTKSGLSIMSSASITLAQPFVQGIGNEPIVVGTIASMTAGQLSSPIKGTNGVYVVLLESITKAEPLKDVAGERAKVLISAGGRADASASEILLDEANITDNRGKYF